ncbi:hypothetical protein MVEN_02056500 [Mycena venus]|uniref:Phosphatidic acid phosphatase type 2/haloperoxidase domain-containing protein n=1 Tax=Mycena venus TaxID=2733690 RepID=A0A8H6XD28_9AGAR|nr:hypothetical protein MVEN_02056500 [Mycena venus]
MAVEPLLATRAQRAFILTITLQAIVVLTMVGITFRKVEVKVDFRQSNYKTLPCYLALFALAEVFELLMALDALRLRNIIQLMGILLFHMALIVFAAIQIHETKSALVGGHDCTNSPNLINCPGPGSLWNSVQPFLIVVPCVIAFAWFLMMFWIKELYSEFGWAIFHVVGANPKMKRMYQWYQIMLCLLKFDFFFFVGVTMQLLIIVLARNSAEFGVTITAIPVVLVLLALCRTAVQREIKWLMTVSLVMMLAASSYYAVNVNIRCALLIFDPVYKLVRIYEPSSRELYATTRASLTIFTIVAFLLLFASFAVGLRCFADFDRGLQASKVNGCRLNPPIFQTNIVVTGLTAISILTTRSAGVAYFGAGALACSLSVKFVLKRIIRQPRPVGKKKTYGMPSTHSASIAYYATFVPLACLYLPLHPSVPGGETARVVAPIIVLPLAVMIAISRVALGHHTWTQVVAGCAFGVAWACLCFTVWTRGLNEYGRTVEQYSDELFGWR